jgi:hypothetical protein
MDSAGFYGFGLLRNVDVFREFPVRYSGENWDLLTAARAFLRINTGRPLTSRAARVVSLRSP